jgi:OmpA-OmpF porin, OOP family
LEQMNIAPDRLVAKGYGEDHPVGDNSTAEGRALNRRISMLVTAK